MNSSYFLVTLLVISGKTLSSEAQRQDSSSTILAPDDQDEAARNFGHSRMAFMMRPNNGPDQDKPIDCSKKGKCTIQLKERKLDSTPDMSCACDRECSKFGDCCEDSKFINLHAREPTSCHTFDSQSYYVIDWCPPDETDEDLIRRCEKGYDFTDPLGSLPLTDIERRITYRNLHCAQCHDDLMDKVWWYAAVHCGMLEKPFDTPEYVQENLIQDNETFEWRLQIMKNGTRESVPCTIGARFTEQISTVIRACKPDLVDYCPPGSDPELEKMCKHYLAPRYDDYNINGPVGYRNVHCAMCHNADVNSLSCLPKKPRVMDDGITPKHSTPKIAMPVHVSFPVLLDIKGTGKPGHKKACMDPNHIMDPFRRTCVPVFCSKGHKLSNYKCISGDLSKNVTSSAASPAHKLEYCIRILLQEGFYTIQSNGTVHSTEYNRTFTNGSYEIDGNKVYVCADFINYEVSLNKFTNNMGLITMLGLGISIVALICHIITFTLVSEVRNLSGKNLLCLSITLILAYSSFILMQCPEIQRVRNLCTAVGVAVCYFFLASMGWMNVIAMDVWRTLRIATIELRVSNGKKKLRFFFYSLYAWSFSGVFIVAALLADNVPGLVSENFRPGFGRSGHCWFDKRGALIVFFAAPIAIIMVINLIAFVFTAAMVTKSASESKSFSNQHSISHKLYFKLMLLMGLTWIVGFIASVADSLYLWYLFIVLNTLQGLFIFIAFSPKRKACSSVGGVITRITSSLSGTSYSFSASNLSQNQSKIDSEITSKSSTKHTG